MQMHKHGQRREVFRINYSFDAFEIYEFCLMALDLTWYRNNGSPQSVSEYFRVCILSLYSHRSAL